MACPNCGNPGVDELCGACLQELVLDPVREQEVCSSMGTDVVAPPRRSVIFFSNGHTSVYRDEEQVLELQTPWVTLFAQFLEENGENPRCYRVTLPSNRSARYLKDSEGRWTCAVIGEV